MDKKLYTVTDVAELFGKTRQTVHNWIDAGRFPNYVRLGGEGSTIVIPASDVESVKREEADKLVAELDRLGFRGRAA